MDEEHSREEVCASIQESNPERIFPETGKFTKVFFEGACRGAPEASKFGKRLMEILRTRGPAHGHLEGSCSSIVKESYRGEDRQPPLCIGSPGVQQPFGGALLQDGDPDIRMQDDQEERLHIVPGLGESLHAFSDPPDMQEIPEVCLERRVQGEVFREHRKILLSVYQSGIQNQHKEVESDSFAINNSLRDGDQFQIDEPEGPHVQDQGSPSRSQKAVEGGENEIEMSGELHWESSSKVGSPPPKTSYVEKSIGTKELITFEGYMVIESDYNQASGSESSLSEEPAEKMERTLFYPREPRAGGLYRFKRHCLGDSCGIEILLGHVASFPDIPKYKRE
ncbi:hypothetical protein AYI68_g1440 [Smittium mucronatum]|uniref:Uncharacterized protein n=1 Tax=Smittium mucronatum TaxID=133383 RepID=A0A1R0H5H6_9FUNG|nr:hypothetical protein AYI68_g1440 [Smittium mucronatum]